MSRESEHAMTDMTNKTDKPQQPSKATPAKAKPGNTYKATLNLPKTGFPMKANLVQNEPASVKRWAKMGLYARLRERGAGGEGGEGRERFVFHDGPPYANGSLHLGHVLNKTLKDLVVRSRTMMGFDVPFVPGWDCHGLPIEHKVMTGLVESGKMAKLDGLPEDARKSAIRSECGKSAKKFIKIQAGELDRLMTIADYKDPYLTMQPAFEGAVLETLADLVAQGLVFQALKPVHWSIANETALAEAELEYEDREDLSVFVDFAAEDAGAVYEAFGIDAPAREERGLGQTPSFMIWTTTPWTLPANLAIAVNRRYVYALVRIDGNVTVLAEGLVEQVAKAAGAAGAEEVETLATTTGDTLVGLRYRHAFIDAAPKPAGEPEADTKHCYTIVEAEYVTLEDGTGLVHTAPGHGADDFMTGVRVGLPTYCPVLADGSYDETVPEWLRGMDIWEANELIAERLQASGHLFASSRFTHSYPHDWRSKTPVIFRSTEQWFIGVDIPYLTPGEPKDWPPASLRSRALSVATLDLFAKATDPEQQKQIDDELKWISEEQRQAVEDHQSGKTRYMTPEELQELDAKFGHVLARARHHVDFIPKWGKNRLHGMLESRPDWCISRQRSWGLPIPAFFTESGDCLMTTASVRAVAKLVREKGSDVWFKSTPEELLAYYDPKSDPELEGNPQHPGLKSGALNLATLKKSPDILDVWFESGSTWNACMRERLGEEGAPIELYLEGSDQHRGWFQSSLLTALGATGRPPFKAILTHGFMVGKDGKKLSKSAGHTVEDLFKLFGADVIRWWVCSLSYENDMKVDDEFFKLAGESYRKVRNTLRFMLSNLADFTASEPGDEGGCEGHCVPLAGIPPTSIDAWVLASFDALEARVVEAYARYDFRAVHNALYDFCNDTLSAVYLGAVKDRLYCDAADSTRRRRTQTALWDLTDGLCRLLAPVMPHTADEAWRALRRIDPKKTDDTVHLADFLSTGSAGRLGVAADERWAKVMGVRDAALLALEKAKGELGVENPLDAGVVLPDGEGVFAGFDLVDLADLLGVSRVELDAAATEPRVTDLRKEERCERSWKRDGTVKKRADGGMLSDRDAAAVRGME